MPARVERHDPPASLETRCSRSGWCSFSTGAPTDPRPWPSVEVVVTEHGLVGAARAAGVRYAIAAAELDADATWIANTDSPRAASLGAINRALVVRGDQLDT